MPPPLCGILRHNKIESLPPFSASKPVARTDPFQAVEEKGLFSRRSGIVLAWFPDHG